MEPKKENRGRRADWQNFKEATGKTVLTVRIGAMRGKKVFNHSLCRE